MKNKNILIIGVILVLSFFIVKPINTYAKADTHTQIISKKVIHSLKGKSKSGEYDEKKFIKRNCKSLLGDPKDPKKESFAWLLQEIFNVVKYVGPFLLLVLSSIDFTKTIIQSDEESMNRAQKRLLIRIVLVLILFFIPDLIMVLLSIFGLTDDPTCGIE